MNDTPQTLVHVEARQAEQRRLERRVMDLEAQIRLLQDERDGISRKIVKEEEHLYHVRRRQQTLANEARQAGQVIVEEHALLRYLERVEGVDMAELRRKVLPETVERQAAKLGSGTFPAGSHRLRIKNGVVMTVLADGEE